MTRSPDWELSRKRSCRCACIMRALTLTLPSSLVLSSTEPLNSCWHIVLPFCRRKVGEEHLRGFLISLQFCLVPPGLEAPGSWCLDWLHVDFPPFTHWLMEKCSNLSHLPLVHPIPFHFSRFGCHFSPVMVCSPTLFVLVSL